MKQFYFFLLLIIISFQIYISGQTFTEPPGPENVLVVYRTDHPYSLSIKNYYIDPLRRNIPLTNIVPINLTEIPLGITFDNDGEIIKGDGIITWNYVKEKIADPIEQHLNTTYYNGQLLKDIIRYIVLCKGIPLKIDDTSSLDTELTRKDVSIDALLCLLNQEEGRTFIDLYGTFASGSNPDNPYFNTDPHYTLDYRFVSNHFENEDGWKLQYLVTRLDGDNYEDIEGMINRSIETDLTGEKMWIMDGCNTCPGAGLVPNTVLQYNLLGGINYIYDNSDPSNWITEWNDDEVIGYLSHGHWAGMPSTYIVDNLSFQYSNGAIFNSIESYNGNSYFPIYRANDQGLITEFIKTGGTVAGGNVWEPSVPNFSEPDIAFLEYIIGYNSIDAIWMGTPHIGFRQTVVGDPLTMIFDPTPITLPNGYTFTTGTYTGHYYVPVGNTVYFASDANVTFTKNASLKVDGQLMMEQNSLLNLSAYSSLKLSNGVLSNNIHIANNSSLIIMGEVTLAENFNLSFYDNSMLLFSESGKLTFGNNSSLNFDGSSTFAGESIVLSGTAKVNFSGGSTLNTKKLFLPTNTVINFTGDVLTTSIDRLEISAGSVLNLNLILNINNSLIMRGELNSKIIINNTTGGAIKFVGMDTLSVNHTNFNTGKFWVNVTGEGSLKEFFVSDCSFNTMSSQVSLMKSGDVLVDALITNSLFSDFNSRGLERLI